jgi:hypothetical protein
MIDAAIQSELLREVEQLPPTLQRKVVDFARSLGQSRYRGTPSRQLLEFAGILSPEEAKATMAAIEEERQKPNPIVDQIREVRHRISGEFGHDPKRLVEHYMKLQEEIHADRLVRPAKPESEASR